MTQTGTQKDAQGKRSHQSLTDRTSLFFSLSLDQSDARRKRNVDLSLVLLRLKACVDVVVLTRFRSTLVRSETDESNRWHLKKKRKRKKKKKSVLEDKFSCFSRWIIGWTTIPRRQSVSRILVQVHFIRWSKANVLHWSVWVVEEVNPVSVPLRLRWPRMKTTNINEHVVSLVFNVVSMVNRILRRNDVDKTNKNNKKNDNSNKECLTMTFRINVPLPMFANDNEPNRWTMHLLIFGTSFRRYLQTNSRRFKRWNSPHVTSTSSIKFFTPTKINTLIWRSIATRSPVNRATEHWVMPSACGEWKGPGQATTNNINKARWTPRTNRPSSVLLRECFVWSNTDSILLLLRRWREKEQHRRETKSNLEERYAGNCTCVYLAERRKIKTRRHLSSTDQ